MRSLVTTDHTQVSHREDIRRGYSLPSTAKWESSGGVVLLGGEGIGLEYVLLVAPKGGFGGHAWTFPKGRIDLGETIRDAAVREVLEESGIGMRHAPDNYLGRFEGTSSFTHFFLGVRHTGMAGVGCDHESEDARWFLWADAFHRLSSGKDRAVLRAGRHRLTSLLEECR